MEMDRVLDFLQAALAMALQMALLIYERFVKNREKYLENRPTLL